MKGKTEVDVYISIIVPVYNVEDYLLDCLDSIKNQTFTSYEAILVDDGSTDSSGRLCDAYCDKDKRFRVIHQQNKGLAGARNTGLEAAQGKYVIFMDSDDYVSKYMLHDMYSVMEKSVAQLAIAGFEKVTETVYHDVDSAPTYTPITQDQLFEGVFGPSESDLKYIFAWNKIYRREVVSQLRFNHVISEDLDFNLRLYTMIEGAIIVDKPLFYYRQRLGSLSNKVKDYTVSSDWAIDNLVCYKNSILAIPPENKYWRSLGLWKLYKKMFTLRYYNRNTPFHSRAKNVIKEVRNEVKKEFSESAYVSFWKKTLCALFYHIPAFYNLFMWICKVKSKL